MGLKIFIGDCLIKKLDSLGSKATLKDVQSALTNVDKELVRWIDINGLLAPEQTIVDFVNQIVDGKIKNFDDFHTQLSKIHASYEQAEWKWCAKLISTRVQKSITIESLKLLIDEWKTASLKFNDMILQDAMKEFSTETKLSYGIDGDDSVREGDFTAVRGTFEKNSFVKGVKDESVKLEAKAKSVIDFLTQLT
jgi:hypothetical protein